MKPGWNVLLVEDSLADSILIERELKRSGRSVVCRRVESIDEIEKAAHESSWDVVLCDYNLPQMNFQDVIACIQDRLPDAPLLLISSSIDLEKAVALLKLGMVDFVHKDGLARLVPCIERGMVEAATQAARRAAESELAESRRFAQSSLDALSAHIAVLDGEGTILSVNRAWRKFGAENGGIAARVAEGVNYLDVCERDGQDGNRVADMIREVMAGGRQECVHEYSCHSADEDRWFLCRVTRVDDGGVLRVVTAHENISARKEAELEIAKREEDLLRQRNALIALNSDTRLNPVGLDAALRRITETAARTLDIRRASIWRLNRDGTSIECMDLFDSASGLHSGGMELASDDFPVYFKSIHEATIIAADDAATHPDTCEFSREYLPAHGIRSMLDAPIHLRGALYGVVCHEHVASVRAWTSNEKSFAVALASLVTLALEEEERHQTETTLREARERLQRAVKAGKIGLWEWDLETGAADFSAEWLAQAGLPAVAEIGTLDAWYQRVHPDDVGPLRQTLKDCTDNPQMRFQREFRLRHADGDYRWILLSASAEKDAAGNPIRVTGTNIDITDRKQLEQEFQQAQKMESIGRLAGGMAHDFNNMLGVIHGYAELSIASLEEGNPLYENLAQIQRAGDRAASLTRQLLAFSRRQVLRPEVIDIDAVIADMEKMLRRLIGEDIDLAVERTDRLGHVMADPGQIEQILMNLAVNARDAMPRGGCLTIATANGTLDEQQARRRPGVGPAPIQAPTWK